MVGYSIYAMKLFFFENYGFLVYIYCMHPGYQSFIFGKTCACYIRIFTVLYTSKSLSRM